jgi:hypothetical protein
VHVDVAGLLARPRYNPLKEFGNRGYIHSLLGNKGFDRCIEGGV